MARGVPRPAATLRASARHLLVLLLASLGPPGRVVGLEYLAEWCHVGCENITNTSHSWANLAMPKHGNARTADGFWEQYGVPSLLPMPEAGVFIRNVGMVPGWEAVLEKFAKNQVVPRLANHTAIGVFLGDEICCRNTSCWHEQLYPISAKLRALLGKQAILYENECGLPQLFEQLDRIPPDLDWLSIDGYWGYDPAHRAPDGAVEAQLVRNFALKTLYPKMSSSQKIAVVPGTFACSNFSYMPLVNSSRSVVAKLRAYMDWAQADSRLVAMFPWHVNRLPAAAATPGPCDMSLGSADIPGVVHELQNIARWIKANGTTQHLTLAVI